MLFVFVCTYACGGQMAGHLGVFLHCYWFFFFEIGSLTEAGDQLGWQAKTFRDLQFLSPQQQFIGTPPRLGFDWDWTLNSDVRMPISLPIGTSPQHFIPAPLKLVVRETRWNLNGIKDTEPWTGTPITVDAECMITFTLVEYVQKPKFPKRKLVPDHGLKY